MIIAPGKYPPGPPKPASAGMQGWFAVAWLSWPSVPKALWGLIQMGWWEMANKSMCKLLQSDIERSNQLPIGNSANRVGWPPDTTPHLANEAWPLRSGILRKEISRHVTTGYPNGSQKGFRLWKTKMVWIYFHIFCHCHHTNHKYSLLLSRKRFTQAGPLASRLLIIFQPGIRTETDQTTLGWVALLEKLHRSLVIFPQCSAGFPLIARSTKLLVKCQKRKEQLSSSCDFERFRHIHAPAKIQLRLT